MSIDTCRSNSRGTFTLKEYDYFLGDGDKTEPRMMVETCVTWDRKFGRCDRRSFSKYGEIHTRARFRAWLRKYSPSDLAIADQLPTSVWWEGSK